MQRGLEAERVVGADHVAGAVAQHPGVGGAAGERLDQRLQRQAGLLGVGEGLAQRRVGARDDHLVDGLARLPRARRPEVRDGAAERLEHRPGAGHSLVAAAAEDGQRAALGALGAAGDRGVHEEGAPPLELAGELAGDAGRDRRAVHQHRAARQGVGDAAAEHDLLQVGAVRDAGQDGVRAHRGLARRVGGVRAERQERLLAAPGAVVHGHAHAGVHQVPRHGRAHGAEAHHSDAHQRCGSRISEKWMTVTRSSSLISRL